MSNTARFSATNADNHHVEHERISEHALDCKDYSSPAKDEKILNKLNVFAVGLEMTDQRENLENRYYQLHKYCETNLA